MGFLAALVCASGASCPRNGDEILPAMLPPTPTLEQVTNSINGNTSLVRSDWATGSLSVPGAPSIPITLAIEPPLRFRLRASTAITGPEVDIGSNDELFWFWVRRQQPALYFCRHDQFYASSARSILPVEPEWIVEALGLVRLDPAEQPTLALSDGANRLVINSVHHGPAGDTTKRTVVDARTGVVIEQHLYDMRGTRIASAFTSHHHRDIITGAILPRDIRIQCPTSQLELAISLDTMQVNSLGPQSAGMWVKPSYPGYPEVNLAVSPPPLAGPVAIPRQTIPPPSYGPPTNYNPPPAYAPQPGYRAYP
jgi:hypothetical protein